MRRRKFMGVFGLALGIGLAVAMPDARSQIIDMGKYPDIVGRMGPQRGLPMGARREAAADAGISGRL